jgi:hypothetical protein
MILGAQNDLLWKLFHILTLFLFIVGNGCAYINYEINKYVCLEMYSVWYYFSFLNDIRMRSKGVWWWWLGYLHFSEQLLTTTNLSHSIFAMSHVNCIFKTHIPVVWWNHTKKNTCHANMEPASIIRLLILCTRNKKSISHQTSCHLPKTYSIYLDLLHPLS